MGHFFVFGPFQGSWMWTMWLPGCRPWTMPTYKWAEITSYNADDFIVMSWGKPWENQDLNWRYMQCGAPIRCCIQLVQYNFTFVLFLVVMRIVRWAHTSTNITFFWGPTLYCYLPLAKWGDPGDIPSKNCAVRVDHLFSISQRHVWPVFSGVFPSQNVPKQSFSLHELSCGFYHSRYLRFGILIDSHGNQIISEQPLALVGQILNPKPEKER